MDATNIHGSGNGRSREAQEDGLGEAVEGTSHQFAEKTDIFRKISIRTPRILYFSRRGSNLDSRDEFRLHNR